MKWTRKTTEKVARELKAAGIQVSRNTVGRLLREQGYSLRVNHKKLSRARKASKYRDKQFRYILTLRRAFERGHAPIVSVDTKKKELIGQFKNHGAKWSQTPTLVNDHDFKSDSSGLAVPYGVLDLRANHGHVFVGLSHDTAPFAVAAISKWWEIEGQLRYPKAKKILILADGGGSNSSRNRAWKLELQSNVCNRFGLQVTVAHYPPGTSKYNPIEHRLFSEISKNWAGEPLRDLETMLNFIRTTRTETGLSVSASLLPGDFPTGIKVTKRQVAAIGARFHPTLPQWNYTLTPLQDQAKM